jgi:hypothetical protein
VLLQRFKEDQVKIEDGIVSALDRLNKFEDDMDKGGAKPQAALEPAPAPAPSAPPPVEADAESGGESDGGGFVLKEKPYVPEDGSAEEDSAAPAAELDIF